MESSRPAWATERHGLKINKQNPLQFFLSSQQQISLHKSAKLTVDSSSALSGDSTRPGGVGATSPSPLPEGANCSSQLAFPRPVEYKSGFKSPSRV